MKITLSLSFLLSLTFSQAWSHPDKNEGATSKLIQACLKEGIFKRGPEIVSITCARDEAKNLFQGMKALGSPSFKNDVETITFSQKYTGKQASHCHSSLKDGLQSYQCQLTLDIDQKIVKAFTRQYDAKARQVLSILRHCIWPKVNFQFHELDGDLNESRGFEATLECSGVVANALDNSLTVFYRNGKENSYFGEKFSDPWLTHCTSYPTFDIPRCRLQVDISQEIIEAEF